MARGGIDDTPADAVELLARYAKIDPVQFDARTDIDDAGGASITLSRALLERSESNGIYVLAGSSFFALLLTKTPAFRKCLPNTVDQSSLRT